MMDFRHETNLLDAPREIVVVCRHLPPIISEFGADLRHRRFWRENKIAPSPIIVGLEAIINLHTLRHFCCTHQSLLYLARRWRSS